MSDIHYPKSFTDGLEAIWGEGFLSPGGPEEVARMLAGIDLTGKWVLDIGCGLGGIDALLVETHGADRVVGIDVEPQLVSAAASLINRKGLIDQVAIELVKPGPLPFEDAYFDIVFSKDALLHIPDKKALYLEVLRILKPGGWFVASDWLRGGADDEPVPDSLYRWMEATGLTNVTFATAGTMEAAMRGAGFDDVSSLDRNEWYCEEIGKEEDIVENRYDELVRMVGEEIAENRRTSLAVRAPAVRDGHLRPTYLRGRKPA